MPHGLNSFEGLAPGVVPTKDNTGGASGRPFDVVAVAGDGTIVTSSARSAHGTVSMQVVVTASGKARTNWTVVGDEVRARVYLYVDALPTTGFFSIVNFLGNDGGELGSIYLTQAQLVKIQWPGNFGNNTTFKYPLHRWFRIEARAKFSTGELEARLFAGPRMMFYGQAFGGLENVLVLTGGFNTGDTVDCTFVPNLVPPAGAGFQACCVTSDGMIFLSNPTNDPNTVDFNSNYAGQSLTAFDPNNNRVFQITSLTSGPTRVPLIGKGAPLWQCVQGYIDGVETVAANTVNAFANWDITKYGVFPAYQIVQFVGGEWRLREDMMATYDELNANSAAGATVFPSSVNSLGQAYTGSAGWSELDILPYSGCLAGACYFATPTTFTGKVFVIDPRVGQKKVTAYFQPPTYAKDTRTTTAGVNNGNGTVTYTMASVPAGLTAGKTLVNMAGNSNATWNIPRAIVTAFDATHVTIALSPTGAFGLGGIMSFIYQLCPLGVKAWGTSNTNEYFSVRYDTFGYNGVGARPFPVQIFKYNSVTKTLTAATPLFFVAYVNGANVGGNFTTEGDFVQPCLTTDLKASVALFGRVGSSWPSIGGTDFASYGPDALGSTSLGSDGEDVDAGFGMGRPVWDPVTRMMFIPTGAYIAPVQVSGTGVTATLVFTDSMKIYSPQGQYLQPIDGAKLAQGLPWFDPVTRMVYTPILATTNATTDAKYGKGAPYALKNWLLVTDVDEQCGPVTTERRGGQLKPTADKSVPDDSCINTGITGWSGVSVGQVEFGATNVFTSVGTHFFDDAAFSTEKWPGPKRRLKRVGSLSGGFNIGRPFPCFVELSQAYDSDTVVYLEDNSPSVVTPETVVVPAGTTIATFNVLGVDTVFTPGKKFVLTAYTDPADLHTMRATYQGTLGAPIAG